MISAFLLLLIPSSSTMARNVAFGISVMVFGLSLYIYNHFELSGGLQFIEHYKWIKSYGISYSLGIDG